MVQLNSSRFDAKTRPWPGYFEITRIRLNNVDLSDQWVQIDDFESVFSGSKSARVTIVDTKNLIKSIPILGEEIFEMTVTDGVKTIDYTFRVYHLSDRKHLRQGVTSYVLHMCSEEAWADSFIRVSKSFINKPLEQSVEEILKGPLYLKSAKPLLAAKTDGPRSVIVPYWSPIHAVTWMAGRALAEEQRYRGGNFFFWETIDGFKWTSVDNVLDDTANVPYCTLQFNPIRKPKRDLLVNDPRVPRDVLQFESFDVVKTFDSLENSRRGMFANKTRVIDFVDRKHVDVDYNYINDFQKRQHLRGLDGAPSQPISSWNHEAKNFPESHFRVVMKHKGLFDNEPDGNSKIEEWMPNKLSQMQQIENFKIHGQVPGHLGLQAGMLVDFAFPNPESISVNSSPGVDPNYSGQYLVTAVRRTFQRSRFVLSLELARDSRGGTLEGLN